MARGRTARPPRSTTAPKPRRGAEVLRSHRHAPESPTTARLPFQGSKGVGSSCPPVEKGSDHWPKSSRSFVSVPAGTIHVAQAGSAGPCSCSSDAAVVGRIPRRGADPRRSGSRLDGHDRLRRLLEAGRAGHDRAVAESRFSLLDALNVERASRTDITPARVIATGGFAASFPIESTSFRPVAAASSETSTGALRRQAAGRRGPSAKLERLAISSSSWTMRAPFYPRASTCSSGS